jgi:hypothetical protein
MYNIFCVGSINLDFYSVDKTKSPQIYLGGSACNTAFFLTKLINSSKISRIYLQSIVLPPLIGIIVTICLRLGVTELHSTWRAKYRS